jgi:hypothetical protein
MIQAFPESDWKLLRKLHTVALERFCENVLSEVVQLTAATPPSWHARYLELYKLIEDRDHEMGTVFNDLRRSNALIHLLALRSRKLLTENEFAEFTSETQDKVQFLDSE